MNVKKLHIKDGAHTESESKIIRNKKKAMIKNNARD